MYTGTTKAFQDKVISDSRTFRAKLVCGSDVVDSGFRSLKLTNKSVSGDNLELGAAVAAQLEVTVKKPGFMITGREFQLFIGLVAGNRVEYVPMGRFRPQRPKETDNGEISFTAYDRMVSVFKDAYFTDIKSYPADGKKILKEIQTKTGVPVSGLDALPDGVMVDWRTEISEDATKQVAPFQGYTYSETIGYLAQLYGKFATIDRDGALALRWYQECPLQAAANRITSDIESAETVFSVQKLECSVEDKTLTAGSGTMGITMSNPVMTQKRLNSIYKSIGGMEYLPTACTYLGDPRLDLGDIIKVSKPDGTVINVPVMSIVFEYDGGLTATVESVGSEEQTELQKGPMATAMDRVYTDLFLVKNVVANRVTADYVEANYVSTKELDAVNAKIQTLETDNVQINGSLTVMEDAQVTFKNQLTTFEGKVNINAAEITTLKGSFASFQKGDFTDLSADVAKIHTLIYGTAAGESISSQFSNSVVANVGTGVIKDAMIESLSVSKILAGQISTTKFQIVSDSGNMYLADNTMQIRDGQRTRIQIGKDASGDYNMYVWDKTGNLMFDALGLTEKGIQRSIIRDDMVSDEANISAEKLDIGSLFDVINTDGSHTLKASRIYVDADKQTLDVSFKQMTTKVSESVTTASAAKTTASSALSTADTASTNASSAVKTANSANTAATAAKDSADSALNKAKTLETTVSTLTTKVTTQGTQLTAVQGQISSKIWQQDITTAVTQVQIGGRNLLMHTLQSVSVATKYNAATTGYTTKDIYGFSGAAENAKGGRTLAELGFQAGDEVTLSFDYALAKNGSEEIVYGKFRLETAYNGSYKGILINGAWTALSKTKGRYEGSAVLTADHLSANQIRFRIDNTTAVFTISNAKLEKGNKATDWTPAPEDVDSSITALEGTTTTLTTQYTALNQSLNSLKATVNSNTTAISKKADGSTVTTLQSTVTSLTADLKGFKTTVSDTYTSKAEFAGLEIGGRNLLLNTNSPGHTGNVSFGQSDLIYLKDCANECYAGTGKGNTVTPVEHGYTVTVASGNYAAYYINGADVEKNGGMGCLEKGETYTISFDYTVRAYSRDTDTDDKYVRLSIYGNRDAADVNTTMYAYNFATYTAATKGSKLKGRCEYTFTVPDTKTLSYVFFRLHFATGSSVHDSTDYLVFRYIKLEKGNKATDWTPAPEDVDSSITALEGTTTTLKTQYTTLNQSLTSLKASVNSNTTAISKKADGSTVTSLQSTVTSLTADLKGFKTTVSDTYATTDSVSGKADKKSIISQINQTAEKVKISASKLELDGEVTFSCFDSDTQTLINTADSNASTAVETADTAKTTADKAKTTADAADKVITAWCYNKDKTYINGGKIYTGTVTAEKIAANAVTASKIAANAVTADKINVSDLSALKASIGGFTIGSNYLHSATSMTEGKASTQYLTQLTQYSGKDGYAIHVANRTYDGKSYGSWDIPFFVKYDGSLFSSKGKIGGFTIGADTLSCANAMTGGKADTQYQARMIAVGNVTGTTAAFNTRKRSYDGSAYGDWGNTFYVRYDGFLAAYGGGRIGAWYLGAGTGAAGGLYNGMTSFTDTAHNGIWIGTNGIAAGKGNFKVTSAGNVTCQSISSTGNCTFTTQNPKTGGIYTNGNISLAGNIVAKGTLDIALGATLRAGCTVNGKVSATDTVSSEKGINANGSEGIYSGGPIYAVGEITSGSDRRLKKDVMSFDGESAEHLLRNMKPKMYRLIADPEALHIGFIAQEVQKTLQDLHMNENLFVKEIQRNGGKLYTLNYIDMIGVLWKGWQILNRKITQQEEMIRKLQRS